ncbi:MAG: hypothetical protein AAF403_08325, partial [Pseudomonadota bacterium]
MAVTMIAMIVKIKILGPDEKIDLALSGSNKGGIGATLTIDNTALPDDISPALDLFEETETLTTSFIV